MHWQRDRTTPPNWPWSTRNTCDVATHQYISLNNSGIFSFPVPATLVHCAFNWSLILLFVHQLLLGKKPNSIEKHYPRTCILQGALPHTALSSPCSFPNVISFSYNLFSKKIWPLQKGFVNGSAIMELIICFHVRNAAEAQNPVRPLVRAAGEQKLALPFTLAQIYGVPVPASPVAQNGGVPPKPWQQHRVKELP